MPDSNAYSPTQVLSRTGPESPAWLTELAATADSIWESNLIDIEFSGYVSADFDAVYRALYHLRDQFGTFLEWGSGLGVVTTMAARLGYDACGIEAEARLVAMSESLAADYETTPRFAAGSFIPDDYQWHPAESGLVHGTQIDIPAGYAALDLDCDDFDLIYAYPWPDEHGLFHDVLRNYARPDAWFLSYDAHEGMQLCQVSQLPDGP